MSQVKGIIMAAGYGTRFLPITKTIPKEMLPLVNKPLIDFILDEFEQAGIEDVIVITQRKKKALDDYLDKDPELYSFLEAQHKTKEQDLIKPRSMNFSFIRQQEMKGTGDALLLTEQLVGSNPFVLAFPDDVFLGKKSLSLQLKEVYEKTKKNILACEEIQGDVSRFGVIDPLDKIEESLYTMKGIIEKPAKGTEPSHIISIGRYLLTPEIFPILKELKKMPRTGEFFLTDALEKLAINNNILSYIYKGQRLDVGDPESYIKSFLTLISLDEKYSKLLKEFTSESLCQH